MHRAGYFGESDDFIRVAFQRGLANERTNEGLFKPFLEWASEAACSKIQGNRFKQEGRVVPRKGVGTMDFGSDTVGGYIPWKLAVMKKR